ncbi:putative bacterial alpha-L-rhamnosidase domain protein [Rosellinia necatrix]|uniref:Putative bacterial alpha-L-rhamnosidase domain protein n=1 Tax=Rosellinia necatrix TaxID=77044 RepID=A0A1W2TVA5_ROSNE|nr:putative bacterial alpha-L-rhamnosidase domain protein [Rosellinia necatrix]
MRSIGLATVLSVVSGGWAASCWRDTPCTGPLEPAFPGDWDVYNYAPDSRSVKPEAVLLGDASSSAAYNGSVTLSAGIPQVVLDFGREVGGITSLNYASDGAAAIGLAWMEVKNWIGSDSDYSNGGSTPDGHLTLSITGSGSGSYEVPLEKLRGGFRYLTLSYSSPTGATVNVSDILLEISFQPTWSNLRAYQGYFRCSDEMLNKIWYAGAYTLQTNTVPVNTGRAIPMVRNSWANNGTLGNGTTIMVDGAKRDRAVWPGDMGVAVPSAFYSIGELESVANALQVMYDYQNRDGSLPEAGPPLLQQDSDTYHMWTLVGTYNYILYGNDTDFLARNWARYQKAIEYIYGKVDDTSGLLVVTGTRDWARWGQGSNNSEANMILYRTLTTGSYLASLVGDGALSATYDERAAALSGAINTHLWDASYGAYRDNATATTLYPQDANALAVLFGATGGDAVRDRRVSARLTENWNALGAVAPELPGQISPFVSSFEVQAHFVAGEAVRALDLVRRSWGWYLAHPNGTASTVVEGYLADGSFAYRFDRGYPHPSYTSHAHGWGAGPTSALTNHVAGLAVAGPAGRAWSLAPQFAGLRSAEAGFTSALGRFRAAWALADDGSYSLNVTTPLGTQGSVLLPGVGGGRRAKITIDGNVGVYEVETVGKLTGYAVTIPDGTHSVWVEESADI